MTISVQQVLGLTQAESWMMQPFQGFCLDSRKVEAGQVFIALTSYTQPEKTLSFAQAALAKGAIGIIAEAPLSVDNCWVCPQVRQEMGIWQKCYLDLSQPTDSSRIFAVTGTNGKTTISRLIAELVSLQGCACAVMGTTGNGILPHLEASTHTTLDAIQLQNALHGYALQGAKFASLEASSHGLEQGRLNGCDVEVAVYSNLSRDHLDYHKTLEAYAEAKARLFAFPTLKVAVINLDDDYAHIMLEQAQQNPSKPQIVTYSLTDSQADFHVSQLSFSLEGAIFNLHTPQGVFEVNSLLLGHFNVENLVASLIAASAAGFDFATLIQSVPSLKGAPGRMQVLRDAQKLFVVDYAHTPDALIQVLTSLQRHVEHRLWAVFGCGGDRDRGKRPLMTQAALAHANPVILTSDNPRTENPEQIFGDMKNGVDFSAHEIHEIHDRRQAIRYVVEHAQAGDIVVIAGKGHENYQEIEGIRHWFDDVVEVDAAIHLQRDISAHSAMED